MATKDYGSDACEVSSHLRISTEAWMSTPYPTWRVGRVEQRGQFSDQRLAFSGHGSLLLSDSEY